jgi:hypothetical protein
MENDAAVSMSHQQTETIDTQKGKHKQHFEYITVEIICHEQARATHKK